LTLSIGQHQSHQACNSYNFNSLCLKLLLPWRTFGAGYGKGLDVYCRIDFYDSLRGGHYRDPQIAEKN